VAPKGVFSITDKADDRNRNACGVEAIGRPDQILKQEAAADGLRHLQDVIAGAPDQPDRFLDHHRGAKGEQQAVQGILAVGSPHAELDDDADEPDRERRNEQRRRVTPSEREREPRLRQRLRERRPRSGQLHGEIGAERKQRAMRQVDLLHQPDDQHEAERNEREQQAERQAVDDMRKKVEQFRVSKLARRRDGFSVVPAKAGTQYSRASAMQSQELRRAGCPPWRFERTACFARLWRA
jgi:hypothetical protein